VPLADRLNLRGVSQRPEIKGLKFLRFGDYPLLLSVRIV
jgi:hypothetical protein